MVIDTGYSISDGGVSGGSSSDAKIITNKVLLSSGVYKIFWSDGSITYDYSHVTEELVESGAIAPTYEGEFSDITTEPAPDPTAFPPIERTLDGRCFLAYAKYPLDTPFKVKKTLKSGKVVYVKYVVTRYKPPLKPRKVSKDTAQDRELRALRREITRLKRR